MPGADSRELTTSLAPSVVTSSATSPSHLYSSKAPRNFWDGLIAHRPPATAHVEIGVGLCGFAVKLGRVKTGAPVTVGLGGGG
ncbi:unnamed protein product [Diplocarpon coronariae]